MSTLIGNQKKQIRIRQLSENSIVTGKIFKKKSNEVYIDLSPFGVGRIYGIEYIKARDLLNNLNVGDEVTVKILSLDDGNGNFEVSLLDTQSVTKWEKLKELMRIKQVLELPILEANKGGLITEIEGIKGFIPVSQLTPEHYPRIQNQDRNQILESLKNLVGKTLKLRIIAVDPNSNKLILSERLAKLEEYKEELSKYSIGEVVNAKIVGVSNFGVFLRFKENPPLEGMVHISEIPEEKRDLNANFNVGDEIKAKIIKIEGDRVYFTLKDLTEDPWISFCRKYKLDDIVVGKFLEKKEDLFGVVEIEGVKGIVFENLEELEDGKEYRFKIKELNYETKKLILTYEGKLV